MSGCNCNSNDNTQPIDIYVELAGNEKQHSSLRGRDEENQHPISAITNLQETIEELNSNIDSLDTETRERLQELSTRLSQDITDIQQQLDNIDLTDFYTKEEIDNKSVDNMRYKGQVTTKEDLPIVGNERGDVYNVVKTGANFVWTGNGWDNLSPALCLKRYATKDYVDGTLDASVSLLQEHLKTHFYEKDEIDEMIQDLDPSNLDKVFVYRGYVANYDKLPSSQISIGDVYKTLDNQNKYFWNGFDWELLQAGFTYTGDEIDDLLAEQKEDIMQEVNDSLDDQKQEINQQLDELNDKLEELEEATMWGKISDVINE